MNCLYYFAFIKPQIKLLSAKYWLKLFNIKQEIKESDRNKSYFNHNKTKQLLQQKDIFSLSQWLAGCLTLTAVNKSGIFRECWEKLSNLL